MAQPAAGLSDASSEQDDAAPYTGGIFADADGSTPVVDACREVTLDKDKETRDAAAFAERVATARAQMDAMRARDWVARRENAASLLKELARALAVAPFLKDDLRGPVCEASGHADAVVARRDAPFQGCAHIKAGLVVLLDALEASILGGDAQRWLESARRAARALDEGGMIAFEGAAIQDAFRTTTDVFVVLAQNEGSREKAPTGTE